MDPELVRRALASPLQAGSIEDGSLKAPPILPERFEEACRQRKDADSMVKEVVKKKYPSWKGQTQSEQQPKRPKYDSNASRRGRGRGGRGSYQGNSSRPGNQQSQAQSSGATNAPSQDKRQFRHKNKRGRNRGASNSTAGQASGSTV